MLVLRITYIHVNIHTKMYNINVFNKAKGNIRGAIYRQNNETVDNEILTVLKVCSRWR